MNRNPQWVRSSKLVLQRLNCNRVSYGQQHKLIQKTVNCETNTYDLMQIIENTSLLEVYTIFGHNIESEHYTVTELILSDSDGPKKNTYKSVYNK